MGGLGFDSNPDISGASCLPLRSWCPKTGGRLGPTAREPSCGRGSPLVPGTCPWVPSAPSLSPAN